MLGHAGDCAMSKWQITSRELPEEDVPVRIYHSLTGFHDAALIQNGHVYPYEPPYFVTDDFDTFETHEIEQWRYL